MFTEQNSHYAYYLYSFWARIHESVFSLTFTKALDKLHNQFRIIVIIV